MAFRCSLFVCIALLASQSSAFVASNRPAFVRHSISVGAENENYLTRVADDVEGVSIPFLDADNSSFIECYADCVAVVGGNEYTIGIPCDYPVALCYMDGAELLPVELDDPMMDDIFLVAENIVAEEFGEELSLQRTSQTLTLMGELDTDDDEDEDDDDDDDEGGNEVEVLLTFEHRNKEFNLVRILDPMLLVGKPDSERPDIRRLLSIEESDKMMPILEKMFLEGEP